MQYVGYYCSPLGDMTLTSDGISLTGLSFEGQKSLALLEEVEERDLPIFAETKKWLDIYFSGRDPQFTPKVSFRAAPPFRLAVWGVLAGIPYGKTVTYGEIAEALSVHSGRKVSARAVGGAAGRNPVSLIVPCHRVIGNGGNLTGYASGLERKKLLLDIEAGRKI